MEPTKDQLRHGLAIPMTESKPKFSVLMPTYNRCQLLPFAIKSVLQQSFTDFEIVISNGGSTDGTAGVVRSFEDSRIRYVESSQRLNIGDNYQQAYDHARGEYITFLSDDDAFVPRMLERVNEIILREEIEILVFKSAFYFQDLTDYYGHRLPPKSVFVHDFSSKLFKYSGFDAACGVFGNADVGGRRFPNFSASFLANAIYHNSVFKKIRQKTPRFFETTPADGYLAAAAAFVVDTYHFLDEPLHVWTNWEENVSASPERKGEQLVAHYESLLIGTALDFVPLKTALPMNCYLNAIFKAKSVFDPDDRLKIDWGAYYSNVFRELMHARLFGLEVGNELSEFRRALANEPAEVREQVSAEMSKPGYHLKYQIHHYAPILFRAIKRMVSSVKKAPGSVLVGKKDQIEDVLAASNIVNSVGSTSI